MNAHADKSDVEINDKSNAGSLSGSRRNNPPSNFVDNRPETVAQRKMQAMANESASGKKQHTLDLRPESQQVIQQSSGQGVIQRVSMLEILKIDLPIQTFANIMGWLQERTGAEIAGAEDLSTKDNNWDRFLEKLSIDEVYTYSNKWAKRNDTEADPVSLEDMVDVGPGLQWSVVVHHINNSFIKDFATGKLDAMNNPVVILKDAEFTAAHLDEYKKLNGIENITEKELFAHNKDIDTVNGFHSKVDDKIYLRKEVEMAGSYHYAIHEAVHKCSSHNYSKALGHVFNEATTELIARKICKERNLPLSGTPYESEITLVMELADKMKLDIESLEKAYFSGEVDAPYESLAKLLKEKENYVAFVNSSNAGEARFTYEISQIEVQVLEF